MKQNIRKGDVVLILSGCGKGRNGRVMSVLPKKGLVKIEGVRVATRHVKARAQGQKSSIVQSEVYIPLSTVKMVQAAERKVTRTRTAKQNDNA